MLQELLTMDIKNILISRVNIAHLQAKKTHFKIIHTH